MSVSSMISDPLNPFSSITNVPTPDANNVAGQYLALLQGFEKGAPTQLALQQQYQPQYTQADLGAMNDSLKGINGEPGYLSMFSQDVVPAITSAQTTANTATRTGTMNDLSTLLPGLNSTIAAANPGGTALQSALTKSATDQLALGTQLDPNAVYQATQPVAASYAARGLGTSDPSQLAQSLQLYAGGQNALTQRQNTAATVSGTDYSQMMQPLNDLMGITSTAPGQAQNLTSTGTSSAGGAQPTIAPTSDLTSLFSGAYNTNANALVQTQNNKTAIAGDAMGALSSF